MKLSISVKLNRSLLFFFFFLGVFWEEQGFMRIQIDPATASCMLHNKPYMDFYRLLICLLILDSRVLTI
jgi:hypothetical protein